MADRFIPDPPWLYVLNTLQLEWREREFRAGRDPDRLLEQLLVETGKWPPRKQPQKQPS